MLTVGDRYYGERRGRGDCTNKSIIYLISVKKVYRSL